MIQHVYPPNDTFPHKLDGAPCDCIPEFETDEYGHILIIHNAYDGRDLIEKAERGGEIG